MSRYKIGIDLGGTKLLGILADQDYQILWKKKIKLPQRVVIEDIIELITGLFNEFSQKFEIEDLDVIGLAVPSPVDNESGVAHFLPAFGWKNIPFKQILIKKINIDFRVENDVNMATLAEYKLGAGRGVNSLYTLYPGTGIGGGYINKGELVRGLNGTAGEIGHMVVDINGALCKCGQRGCLETIVSNIGFKRLFKEAIISGTESSIENIDSFTSEILAAAYHAGDLVVQNVLNYQASVLGIAIANVINLTGIERIIIGGQVYHQLKNELLPIVEQSAAAHSIGGGMLNVEIRLNELGSIAPALGVTLL